MIDAIFLYNNGRIELNVPEILLVKEFAKLMEPLRNKCKDDPEGKYKLRAFREFTYIWLAIDWKSIYSEYSEQERHLSALLDADMTEEEWNDPDFRAACRKYREILEQNKSIKLLHAAKEMVDKFIEYFETADPLERDPQTGKPVFKVKDIQAEMKNLIDVHSTLIELENNVKKAIEAQTSYRGNVREDFDPGDF